MSSWLLEGRRVLWMRKIVWRSSGHKQRKMLHWPCTGRTDRLLLPQLKIVDPQVPAVLAEGVVPAVGVADAVGVAVAAAVIAMPHGAVEIAGLGVP